MLRNQFPILATPGLAYLDSAASAQKPLRVLDAMNRVYKEAYANVHRGLYPLGEASTLAYENARETVARFLHCAPQEVVFTRNATEALNLVAMTWGRANVQPGDIVLTTIAEHHSNFLPWQALANEKGAEFRVLPVTASGELDLQQVAEVMATGRVRVMAVAHVSNVLGVRNPISRLADLAHRHGAILVVDGAQAVGHARTEVDSLGCDFYAFSGHKAYGPTGIGVLYGKSQLLQQMPPLMLGGEMIRSVSIQRSTWADAPQRFEAGTPPFVEAVGLAEALTMLQEVGIFPIMTHEARLVRKLTALLSAVPGVTVLGPPPGGRTGLVSFTLQSLHPHDIAGFLGTLGVSVRAGHHCAQPLHDALGIPASVRVSLGLYNDAGDLIALGDALGQALKFFGVQGAQTPSGYDPRATKLERQQLPYDAPSNDAEARHG